MAINNNGDILENLIKQAKQIILATTLEDLYQHWVNAQKVIEQTKFRVNGDWAQIRDVIEISPGEVKLKGMESISVLKDFVEALQTSIEEIDTGLKGLDECLKLISEGNASASDRDELVNRRTQFGNMRECCLQLKDHMQPVTYDNIKPLLDPKLFELIKRLSKFFGESSSPPIIVKVTYKI